jgi:hypothetical protein
MNKLTPELYLFMTLCNKFRETNKKEPDNDEKMHILAKCRYDYKNLGMRDRLDLDRHVDMINDINHLNDDDEERKPKKKCKSKLNRKK